MVLFLKWCHKCTRLTRKTNYLSYSLVFHKLRLEKKNLANPRRIHWGSIRFGTNSHWSKSVPNTSLPAKLNRKPTAQGDKYRATRRLQSALWTQWKRVNRESNSQTNKVQTHTIKRDNLNSAPWLKTILRQNGKHWRRLKCNLSTRLYLMRRLE